MRKIILTIFFGLTQVTLTLGQSTSIDTSKSKTRNFQFLNKGVNIGGRAGIDSKNTELLAGYYFDLVNIKRHRLITFDNDIWTNFKRTGINSTVSYSNDLLALSYSTDVFHDKKQLRVIPAFGLSFGYNDLFSIGLFYNHKFNSEIDYPTFVSKLIVRPAFIHIVTRNPDGSKW